jgi:hypothetical protein
MDWDSSVVIKKTGYKIFTGLSQGTVKVLKDPEARTGAAPKNWFLRGRETEHPLPWTTREEQHMQKKKFLLATNPSQQIKGSFERNLARWKEKIKSGLGLRQPLP